MLSTADGGTRALQDLAAASAADLEDVPGVGKVLAARISAAVFEAPPSLPSGDLPSQQPPEAAAKAAAGGTLAQIRDLQQSAPWPRPSLLHSGVCYTASHSR